MAVPSVIWRNYTETSMKTISFKRGLPRTLALLVSLSLSLSLLMSSRVPGSEDQSKVLHDLKAGIDEYLKNVEFKCTYTYSEYLVDSKDEAERFDTSAGELVLRATGSLIKSEKMTFESFELDKANTKGNHHLDNHITVTNSDLRVNYVKQGEDVPHRTIFVSELEKNESGIPLLDQAYAPITCPLTYGGGRGIPNFIDLCNLKVSKYPNETTIDVSRDKDSTIISKLFDSPDRETSSSVLTLSNAYPYPVMMSRNDETYSYPRNANSYGTTQVFDLVDVGKGFVAPKTIYDTTGPIRHKDFGEEAIGKWIVRKWESDDLGKAPPKAKDFLIPLDRDTDFGGLDLELEHKLNRHVPEYFDINSFSLADLQNSPGSNAPAPEINASKYYRPALIVLGVLIVAAGIYRRWRNRGRRHADQS